MAKRTKSPKIIDSLTHKDAARKNIPTAEYESIMDEETKKPIALAYDRRNRDLDPQLVWRGKDEQNWSDLIVQAPPLYIQEKIHAKALIDDLKKRSKKAKQKEEAQPDLFADFNGIADPEAKTEFYKHDANWTNRMILGDSLQVMASLAEREGLRGQVQCIYFDPPYGIKFNSNFQWSTTSRDVKDGKTEHITREPEQVKAFRDTWRDGIHSYLTYLRDRLTVARDLLTDSGSIFVQIGDENVHRVRALMDEVFGDENFVSLITIKKSGGMGQQLIDNISDYIVWYVKSKAHAKYRQPFREKVLHEGSGARYRSVQVDPSTIRPLTKDEALGNEKLNEGERVFLAGPLTSETASSSTTFKFDLDGHNIKIRKGGWKTSFDGMMRLKKANRLLKTKEFVNYKIFFEDFKAISIGNLWDDTMGTAEQNKVYVVQTATKIVQRCMLMTSDPGDLVLDPTCGSGTTAFVAEQWGRRWITIDTSRVSLALARARIMGAKYPYYLLADSIEGQQKEAAVSRKAPSTLPTFGNIRQGFVYERVPHIMLKDIANNTEIDVIWDTYQEKMEPVRAGLNKELGEIWEEWEIPRESGYPWSAKAQALHHSLMDEIGKGLNAEKRHLSKYLTELNAELHTDYTIENIPQKPYDPWPIAAEQLHAKWWKLRIARQKEMDASIAANAEQEFLYDKPFEDKSKVRVAGPFTVESLSPHRTVGVDAEGELITGKAGDSGSGYNEGRDFTRIILENLKMAGVQQSQKSDKITFTSLTPWPGDHIAAIGVYEEKDENGEKKQKKAGIFIGPEFGTVSRPDLVAAAREAGDANLDVLIACAFSYEAHASEFSKLGRIPVLKARMNADLHMADDLTGKGNLFVIFGEPDVKLILNEDGTYQVKINGVDVFHPQTGEIRSDNADGIACWFLDTDYNEESFFVRHAYFLGAGDPYKSLKTTLKNEINKEAWETLNSDTSRPFEKPESGRIAVKVINHLGDEVMKVFRL